MFETIGQLSIFIKCVGIGGICGVFFLFSNGIKAILCNRICNVIFDVVAFILSSVSYIIVSYKLGFSSLRVYMPIGFLLGLYLYFKSFNYLLAKIFKRPYNIIKEKIKKKLKEKRKAKDERIKVKKNSGRVNRRGSVASRDFAFNNGISVSIHKRKR